MFSKQDQRSRLPRPNEPTDRAIPTFSKKRKATDDGDGGPSKMRVMMESCFNTAPVDEEETQVRLVLGPAAPSKPPQPGNRRPLANSNSQNGARRLRSSSAPPIKSRPVVGIVNGRRRTPEPGATRNTGRTVSGTVPVPVLEETSEEAEEQMADIMAAEGNNGAQLGAFRFTLKSDLAAATVGGSEIRRGMIAAADELDDLKRRHVKDINDLKNTNTQKDKRIEELLHTIRELEDEQMRDRDIVKSTKDALAERVNVQTRLEAEIAALKARCDYLSSEGQAQQSTRAQLVASLQANKLRVDELETELREAESLRRKLHNQIQELKGNIRVFCRVRPALSREENSPDGLALLDFPDRREHTQIIVTNTTETAMGSTRELTMPFAFDRVFEPESSQTEVFEEISYLVQSCIDGYNVCIFAYGQTGSGKSYTMEGGPDDRTRGMIPRAVRHVFDVAKDLERKGWTYSMEGQFLEIYNETIVDLLGKKDSAKHEIKHEKGRTTVTDVVVYPLHGPDQVQKLLSQAQARRTVHATLMNDRSSRSHSVFTLRIKGTNKTTGETCEGCLNLVDLAGSERLKESGALNHKDRLKETQAINKSLSALGDVIAALGERGASGEKHIPYRNSKLTYLLQNSLSGNSKTLMFVNVSPLAAHIGESICSLRFATKVNTTTLGVAKKQQGRIAS